MAGQLNKPSFWKRLPPLYKKRLVQALAAYLVVMIGIGAFTHLKGPAAIKEWESRIPHVETPVLPDAAAELPPPPDVAAAASVAPDDTGAIPAPAPAPADSSVVTAPLAAAPEGAPVVVPPQARKAAYVSVIMANAGMSDSVTNTAFGQLPADFAFAWSPYAGNLSAWIKKSAVAKREALLLVPMEPTDFPKEDPGPKTLLTRLSAKENDQNLSWILNRVEKGAIVGVMNDKGSRLLGDTKTLLPIFSSMAQKNLNFVENPEESMPQAASTADMAGLSYVAADIRIDRDASSAAAIQQKLTELEKIAMDRGYAIGVAEFYPISVSTLKHWADSLDSRGIRLVPLTQVLKEMSQPVDHEKKQ